MTVLEAAGIAGLYAGDCYWLGRLVEIMATPRLRAIVFHPPDEPAVPVMILLPDCIERVLAAIGLGAPEPLLAARRARRLKRNTRSMTTKTLAAFAACAALAVSGGAMAAPPGPMNCFNDRGLVVCMPLAALPDQLPPGFIGGAPMPPGPPPPPLDDDAPVWPDEALDL